MILNTYMHNIQPDMDKPIIPHFIILKYYSHGNILMGVRSTWFLKTHFQRIIYLIDITAPAFQIYLSQCMSFIELTHGLYLTKYKKKKHFKS